MLDWRGVAGWKRSVVVLGSRLRWMPPSVSPRPTRATPSPGYSSTLRHVGAGLRSALGVLTLLLATAGICAAAPEALQTEKADPHRGAEYTIDATGRVTMNSGFHDGSIDLAWGLHDSGKYGDVFVRIVAVSTLDPSDPSVVAEGRMNMNSRLWLPSSSLPKDKDFWRVELYVAGQADDGASSAARIAATNAPQVAATSPPDDPELMAKDAATAATLAATQAQEGATAATLAAMVDLPAARKDANEAAAARPPDAAKVDAARARYLSVARELSAAAAEAEAAVVASKAAQDLSTKALKRAQASAAAAEALWQAVKPAGSPAKVCSAVEKAVPTQIPTAEKASCDAVAVLQSVQTTDALVTAAATLARANGTTATNARDGAFLPNCYAWFGTFELPATRPSSTTTLTFSAPPTPPVSLHVSSGLTAWATQVPANKKVTFTWQIVADTSTSLPAVLVEAAEASGLIKPAISLPPTQSPANDQSVTFDPGPTSLAIKSAIHKSQPVDRTCPVASAPLAGYRSVVQTSAVLRGSPVRNRVYTVTAILGDGKPPPPANANWTVSTPTTDERSAGAIYHVAGPRLVATDSTQNPNKVQTQFVSRPGWDWGLLTAITFDSDLAQVGSKNGYGSFPTYQWRPTSSVNATEQLYELDNAYQPLQRMSVSVAIAALFPEVRSGRWGFAAGPSLLFGTGTSGALQQWMFAALWSPPIPKLTNSLYIVVAPAGFRFVNELVGDYATETVAVPRTNGNAPAPTGPTTHSVAEYTMSIGVGLDLAVIGRSVAALTGGGSSSLSNSATSGGQ